MPRVKKTAPLPELAQSRTYSNSELLDFDKKVRPLFFVEKSFFCTGVGKALVFDTESYLKASGGLTASGVVWSIYELEMNRIEQWARWCGKRQYAQKKNIEELSREDINKFI